LNKSELLTLFSSDYEKYYKVSLFEKLGFVRQSCSVCSRFFWAIPQRSICPDHENYTFIGNPPTSKRFSYTQSWEKIRHYFKQNDHTIVNRYPVVCRWRDDLYYTIASIVDFQRVADSKVMFELPGNPLVVPQMCLRFNDIENVGITGRHYTSFCMIGQTCDADSKGGYWKDKCIELDFGLLVDVFGISPAEITFVEDVWIGAGAFGSSLEYFVRGLELGNAVFTEFEGNEKNHRVLKNKIIDMGAGLERLSWITNGTSTSYDCTFEPVLKKIYDTSGMDNLFSLKGNYNSQSKILSDYFSRISSKLELTSDILQVKKQVAQELSIEFEKLQQIVVPYESLYTIIDHTRTLVFAISDGSLPSNVGGGYNLRVILRRTLSLLKQLGIDLKVADIVDMHLDQLQPLYPELLEYRNDIHEVLDIESKRFVETQGRIDAISTKIKKGKIKLQLDDLIRLYESDGVTPDYLVDNGLLESVPANFYTRLSELHSTSRSEKRDKNEINLDDSIDLDSITPTKLLYYDDPINFSFDGKILRIINKNWVVLDKTCFYPRGGGQEPDFGYIGAHKVDNVIKIKDKVLHHMIGTFDQNEGDIINCVVEKDRRLSITKNHTATHIINHASKSVLGSWVWQNSAYKDESYARLDITHHSALSRQEMQEIERKANEIIRRNLPVKINFYTRGVAEQNYSFRIYQGGVVPSNDVRIVNIGGLDIEACGGTHVFNTGELGLIKILKTERIQDGVVRIEFVAGSNALIRVQEQDDQIQYIVNKLGTNREKVLDTFSKSIEELDKSKKKIKSLLRSISIASVDQTIKDSLILKSNSDENRFLNYYFKIDEEFDDQFHLLVGQSSTARNPELVYISVIPIESKSAKVIVFCGNNAIKIMKASELASQISKMLGGSGGGTSNFGQGGGNMMENLKGLEDLVKKNLLEKLDDATK
jgi:alanyl-tRNA synthetase